MQTLIMILKMAGITALYVLLTVLIWKRVQKAKPTLPGKLAIGVIYGICAVLSTHFGVDYSRMLLNVRDLGPLSAGLFFDPISGIVAGLIGSRGSVLGWDVLGWGLPICQLLCREHARYLLDLLEREEGIAGSLLEALGIESLVLQRLVDAAPRIAQLPKRLAYGLGGLRQALGSNDDEREQYDDKQLCRT